MAGLGARLARLEQQAAAEGEPPRPLVVVRRFYRSDGTPMDPTPVPECDVLIRRGEIPPYARDH
ncbi:MAG TPA: hypothetical protein VGR27_09920 [Longimicrobiaceae bacterium]|nr:hypothetical protein [Longimicrobiaceae bacterium]